jgi:hypothetical protein
VPEKFQMNELFLALALIVIVGVVIWAAQKRRRGLQAKDAANQKINEALNEIVREARKSKIHVSDEKLEGDTAIEDLRALSVNCPDSILKEIDKIEALWAELGNQVDQFGNQSVHSTLQSSIAGSKIEKLTAEINERASAVRAKL